MEIDNELLISFCDEANDVLNRWERICLDLAGGVNTKLIEELFRIAHNLKGGSRGVGLFDFGNYIHQVEDVITLIKDGKLEFTDPLQSELLRSQNFLSEWVDQLKKGNLESPNFQKQIEPLAVITSLFKNENFGSPHGMSGTQHSKVEESIATAVITNSIAPDTQGSSSVVAKMPASPAKSERGT